MGWKQPDRNAENVGQLILLRAPFQNLCLSVHKKNKESSLDSQASFAKFLLVLRTCNNSQMNKRVA
jgi:hypothetical protein